MQLRDFFKRLALGELKNLSVVDKDTETYIRESDQEAILALINQGLTSLFSKFILSEKEILLETRPHVTHYFLRPQFARSCKSDELFKYLDDTFTEHFEGDVIKILAVYNEYGIEVPLNDREQELSIFTPYHDCLQITGIQAEPRFSVLYQAKHPELQQDDLNCDIQIPFFLEEALQCYVAGKWLGAMNGAEHSAKGQEHLGMFNYICSMVEQSDMASTSIATTNTKLEKRGFV